MTPRNYIVCSTVRSGSTLLCKTLEQLGNCGCPREYFHRHTIQRLDLNHHPDRFWDYSQTLVQASRDRDEIFGLKLHWWQLIDCLTLARQSPQFASQSDVEILNTLFPDSALIYLYRRDEVAQAVSAAIATQTGQWEKPKVSSKVSQSHPSSTARPVKFQPWRIYEWDQSLREHNQGWQQFFTQNKLAYHAIAYEDLVSQFAQEMTAILTYIGVSKHDPLAGLDIPTKCQATPINQQFIQQYKRLPKPILIGLYQVYRRLRPVHQGGLS